MHILGVRVLFALGLTFCILFCAVSKRATRPQKLMMVAMLPPIWGRGLGINFEDHVLTWAMLFLPWIIWLNFRVWAMTKEPIVVVKNIVKADVSSAKRHLLVAASVTLVSFMWFSFVSAIGLLNFYGFTSKRLMLVIFCLSGATTLVLFALKRHVKSAIAT